MHSIEVAHLVNGEVVSVRRLSRRREVREVGTALAVVLISFGAATTLTAAVLFGAHRVVYGPLYLAVWAGASLAMCALAGWRAMSRARRYAVGVSIEDDAFAGMQGDLVRHARRGYELTIAPGMTGTIEAGRVPVAVESLVRDQPVRLALGPDTRARLIMGATTFVVSGCPDPGRDAPIAISSGTLSGFRTSRDELRPASRPSVDAMVFLKRLMRPTLTVVQLMAVASFFFAVRVGAALGDQDMRSAIPANATPWEAEKLLRGQAQQQARSLHRCFDVMSMECQRPGYVAVGLSLSRLGEIRSSWIARSTFGKECPVEQCMAEVISGWFFEPLPESMQVVLPVQVLRTDRPLPPRGQRGAAPLCSDVID